MHTIEYIEWNTKSPGPDYIPTKDDIVKISRNGERFWTKIVSTNRNAVYVTVENDVFNQPFQEGDVIQIDQDEIILVWID